MRTSSFKIIQILVTCALLSLVFYQVGLFSEEKRASLIDTLKGANFTLLVLSILVGVLINLSSSLKWYMLTRARNLAVGFWRIFSFYLIGQFCNLFLPTSVGGDAVRSYQLGKYCNNQTDALASVFVERYTGVLVLLLVAGIAVLTRLSVFNVSFVIASLILFAVVLGFIAWMLIDERLYQWFRRSITQRFASSEALFKKADGLLASISAYRNNYSAMAWAFINSLVFYFIAVINVYVTALVFETNIEFIDMLIATPIIMLIMNIPISVGNWGLMESAYVGIFSLMGYSLELGLLVAVLMRLKSMMDGAMGGVLYPIFVTNKVE
ncbi:MAG: flippase-like domain-containing protein [Acidiferrobacterales bacterium]|nr:flippase-like domain-containing protein [Acidiferrobacterales bacterium]